MALDNAHTAEQSSDGQVVVGSVQSDPTDIHCQSLSGRESLGQRQRQTTTACSQVGPKQPVRTQGARFPPELHRQIHQELRLRPRDENPGSHSNHNVAPMAAADQVLKRNRLNQVLPPKPFHRSLGGEKRDRSFRMEEQGS
jgi:hypothetical protein